MNKQTALRVAVIGILVTATVFGFAVTPPPTSTANSNNEKHEFLPADIDTNVVSGGLFGATTTPAEEITKELNNLEKVIYGLKSGEILHLHINSMGGSVFPMMDIVQALRLTKGHVIAEVDGLAASAAGVIAINCQEIVIHHLAKFMIHKAVNGNGETAAEDPHGFISSVNNLVVESYKDLLTQEELDILDSFGGQVWLDAKDMSQRLCSIRHQACTVVL